MIISVRDWSEVSTCGKRSDVEGAAWRKEGKEWVGREDE
jgi:hypothetical protein